MGRIRTIKPEFTTDEELSSLPAETHLFAAGLLTYADDEGYFNAHPGLVKAAIFPLRESSVSPHVMLKQLQKIDFIRLGKTADGKTWGQIVKFLVHQYVNRATPSKIKDLQILWEPSLSPHGVLHDPSVPEGKGKEGKGKERGGAASLPLVLPDWILIESWDGFVEMRSKIKKPITEHAKELAVKRLTKFRTEGYDPNEILDYSTLNDYQGLFKPKEKPKKQWTTGDHKNPADWAKAVIPAEGLFE